MFNPFRALLWQTPEGRGFCAASSPLREFGAEAGGLDGRDPLALPPVRLHYEDRYRRPAGFCHAGQLTDLGRQRMWALGQRLRHLYVERLRFLPARYQPETVSVLSTEIPRAVESAQALVGGLFYDGPDSTPHSVLHGPPVHIVVREERSEFLYPNIRQCPRLAALMADFRKAATDGHRDELVRLHEELRPHLLSASELGGRAATAADMYDALASARAHGVKLPPEVTPDLFRRVEQLAVHYWWTPYAQQKEAVRLGVGRVVNTLVNAMEVHVRHDRGEAPLLPAPAPPPPPAQRHLTAVDPDGGLAYAAGPGISLNLALPVVPPAPAQRLTVYSAHDSTVAPLLIALGAYDGQWPDFGSHVTLELLEVVGHPDRANIKASTAAPRHVVRLLYNHQPVAMAECAAAAAAAGLDATLCPYEQFRKIAAEYIPTDMRRECRLPPSPAAAASGASGAPVTNAVATRPAQASATAPRAVA